MQSSFTPQVPSSILENSSGVKYKNDLDWELKCVRWKICLSRDEKRFAILNNNNNGKIDHLVTHFLLISSVFILQWFIPSRNVYYPILRKLVFRMLKSLRGPSYSECDVIVWNGSRYLFSSTGMDQFSHPTIEKRSPLLFLRFVEVSSYWDWDGIRLSDLLSPCCPPSQSILWLDYRTHKVHIHYRTPLDVLPIDFPFYHLRFLCTVVMTLHWALFLFLFPSTHPKYDCFFLYFALLQK